MDGTKYSITELNHEEAKQYVGGVVFVTIIMAIGFVGNLHVLLVYAFRTKPSNHRLFILVLGILDFITCTVGMPFIIFDLRNPLTFTMSSACKILRFINYFICTSSALTLIVIAADRYRKICFPLGRQISLRMAKVLCVLVLVIALLFSWPAPVLYGPATVQTSNPNINGTRCYTEDKENFVKYQGYFNAFLILIVIVCFFVLVVLYTLIWRVISKHSGWKAKPEIAEHPGESSSNAHATTDTIEMTSGTNFSSGNDTEENTEKFPPPEKQIYVLSGDKEININEIENNKGKKSKKLKKTQKQQQGSDRSRKTTFMFLAITIVFFMSYVPHLTLKIVTFFNKSFVPDMSFAEKVVYNTFIWCFFINNMANCFIYGFFDLRFRSEVKSMYSKVLCGARRKVFK